MAYYPTFVAGIVYDEGPLRDRDAGIPGFYWGISPHDADQEWEAGSLWWSLDDSNFHLVGVLGHQHSIIAVAETVLAQYGGSGWDTTNTVDIELLRGTIESHTEDEVQFLGYNWLYINKELIGFKTATLVSGRKYTLSNLLRGMRGTVDEAHAINDYCMLMDHRTRFFPVDVALSGKTIYFKAIAEGALISDHVSWSKVIDFKNWTEHPHGLHNIGQFSVKDKDLADAPSSPAEGDRYIVKTGSSGGDPWETHTDDIALYYHGWKFLTPEEGWRVWVDDENNVYTFDGTNWVREILVGAEAGITADTVQSQGQTPLTKRVNEVSTVATVGDTVTLPLAVAGLEIVVINNGANDMKVFPASGDNINGGGVDAAYTHGNGVSVNKIRYVAYDATNWQTFIAG